MLHNGQLFSKAATFYKFAQPTLFQPDARDHADYVILLCSELQHNAEALIAKWHKCVSCVMYVTGACVELTEEPGEWQRERKGCRKP